ncbi:MAG: IS66 family transposase [Bacteroides sp.]|nr:IS66 family transposase [Bacteroides sp.]
MIGCWARARRKFVEALDEDRKHASEALVYIGRLYGIEKEMQEAGLDSSAVRKRRQEESYKIIQEFEKWMDSVSGCLTPKSRMGRALVYTYTILPRLSRYVLDGRYSIDNNAWRTRSALSPSEERTTSSAETTTQPSEQPSYTHSSAAARPTTLMCGHGWKTHSEESRQKNTLTIYCHATGRHHQLLAATTRYLGTIA